MPSRSRPRATSVSDPLQPELSDPAIAVKAEATPSPAPAARLQMVEDDGVVAVHSSESAEEEELQPPDHFVINYASELNEEQLEAVTAKPGPLLVIAGAGSGKTRTLTYRVAWLIENGVRPEAILLLTFTNKAAREMLDRVRSILPFEMGGMWGGTFHSFGLRLLRIHGHVLGYPKNLAVLDDEDSGKMVTTALKELVAAEFAGTGGLSNALAKEKLKMLPKPALVGSLLSLAVNKRLSLRDVLKERHDYLLPHAPLLQKVLARYRELKLAAGAVDFDDLLELPLRLFAEHPELRTRYQRKFRHILVDEFQDTNTIQAELINVLAAAHSRLMVVGDDAQSIYSWRGANFRNILNFPETFTGARVVRITTNYRSTPPILDLANAAIAPNTEQFPKELRSALAPDPDVEPSDNDGGRITYAKPAVVRAQDAIEQARFVVQRVQELIMDEGVEPEEIAVLYRSHFHVREVERGLREMKIPFELTSGLPFFQQAHIKDVLAFLRLAHNPADELAFMRLAAMLDGVGDKTALRLWADMRSGTPMRQCKVPAKATRDWQQLAETLEQIAELGESGQASAQIHIALEAIYDDYMKATFEDYRERHADLMRLRADPASVEDLMTQAALESNSRREHQDKPRVRLSTIHQAKGLEWKAVFVLNLADTLFPSSRTLEEGGMAALEEERRLFYVAVTRAKENLYLCWPQFWITHDMGMQQMTRSRFVEDVAPKLYQSWKLASERASPYMPW
ncbi:MAG: ATP-dependent helicase [Candidatus Methylacidiphilales bacterium]